MKLGSFGGEKDDEHNGVSFVEIYLILVMQSVFFFVIEPFDSLQQLTRANRQILAVSGLANVNWIHSMLLAMANLLCVL